MSWREAGGIEIQRVQIQRTGRAKARTCAITRQIIAAVTNCATTVGRIVIQNSALNADGSGSLNNTACVVGNGSGVDIDGSAINVNSAAAGSRIAGYCAVDDVYSAALDINTATISAAGVAMNGTAVDGERSLAKNTAARACTLTTTDLYVI